MSMGHSDPFEISDHSMLISYIDGYWEEEIADRLDEWVHFSHSDRRRSLLRAVKALEEARRRVPLILLPYALPLHHKSAEWKGITEEAQRSVRELIEATEIKGGKK